MANDTIGGAGVAMPDSTSRAAITPICLKLVNRPTSPTGQNTPDSKRVAMLEILQQSIQNYIEAGGSVAVLQLTQKDRRPERVAIVLSGVNCHTATLGNH